jgi:Protein of unknown function (DUF1761)
MDTSIVAIVLAVVAQFGIGAFWYMVPFGKIWGEMHGFDKLSKKQQQELQSKMGPWYGVQLFVTILTTVVLALLIEKAHHDSPYLIAFLAWLGFTLPAQASAAIFGGAAPGWIWHKIAISSVGSLISFLAATAILINI